MIAPRSRSKNGVAIALTGQLGCELSPVPRSGLPGHPGIGGQAIASWRHSGKGVRSPKWIKFVNDQELQCGNTHFQFY